ncbi:hypothetical protein H5410_036813 [Solanum commersonii]|uniref:Uncharacterized protein n=1 Tax=Solanum commersonii TaxID=4109 RepID=A0A9J5Y5Y2_SOLCO|nr:hypothetical protein H5410_036813 [Solanum commersonii]
MQQIQGKPPFVKSMINFIYLQLLETHPKVPWKHLIFTHEARPKAMFTIWCNLMWLKVKDGEPQGCPTGKTTSAKIMRMVCTEFIHVVWTEGNFTKVFE